MRPTKAANNPFFLPKAPNGALHQAANRATDVASVRVSLLDFFHEPAASLELAIHAEELGFERYWVAEHQPQPSLPVILSLMAAATEHIQVGAAATLLRIESPIRLACDYQLLNATFPGRILAGVCNGGTPNLPDHIPSWVPAEARTTFNERRCYDDMRTFATYYRQKLFSQGQDIPWFMGGPGTGQLAAELGCAYAVTCFHSPQPPPTDLLARFRSAAARPLPTAVTVAGFLGETKAEAQTKFEAFSTRGVYPSLWGTAVDIADQLLAVGSRYAADEIIFLDMAGYEATYEGLERRKENLAHLAAALNRPANRAVATAS